MSETPGGDRSDMPAAEDVFEQKISRGTALRGLAGAVAAGSLGSLAGAGNAFARTTSKTTTISMWSYHPEWKPVLDSLVASFHKAHPTINVSIDYKSVAAYQGALNTALAAGAAPDVIGWFAGTTIRTGAAAHQILPLDSKLPVASLKPTAYTEVHFKGHTWGVPLCAYTVGIYYQRPIFAKYGLTAPKTWAQLKTLCQTLKNNGVTPWAMPAKDMILPFFFYNLAVSSILGPKGINDLRLGKKKLTDANVVPAAQFMIDLEPYYNDGYQATDFTEGKALFANGQAAMIIGGSADYAGYKTVNPNVDGGVFGFPSQSGSTHVTNTGMEILYSVNAHSKHIPQATTFVAWLASKGAQQKIGNTLALPIIKGVVPKSSRIDAEMIAAGKPDLPVWLDLPQTTNTLTAVTGASGIFGGSLTAAQFAAQVQASIKPSKTL
jgi:ABC-type glycerol-3-phosphate transport system substrate-binding protein